MAFLRVTLVPLLTLAAACSVGEFSIAGDGGTGNGNGMGGGQTFEAQVKPLVTECTNAICHGGAQPPNLSSFAALDAKYKTKPGNTNILVTKGAATGGVHSNIPYLTPAEQMTVATWIDSLP